MDLGPHTGARLGTREREREREIYEWPILVSNEAYTSVK